MVINPQCSHISRHQVVYFKYILVLIVSQNLHKADTKLWNIRVINQQKRTHFPHARQILTLRNNESLLNKSQTTIMGPVECEGSREEVQCVVSRVLCGKAADANIIRSGEFKERAARIMFKHDFKDCKFWQVENPVLKFSTVLNIYSHHYLTAHPEHTGGNAEADCPAFKKREITIPHVMIQYLPWNSKELLSVAVSGDGHCLILWQLDQSTSKKRVRDSPFRMHC